MVGLGWGTQLYLSPTQLGKRSPGHLIDYLLEEISTTYRKEEGLVGGALHLSLLPPSSEFSVPGWSWHLQTTCSPKGPAICSQRWCGFRSTFPVVPRGRVGWFFPSLLNNGHSECPSEWVYGWL